MVTIFRGVNLARLSDMDRRGQRPACGVHTPSPSDSDMNVGSSVKRFYRCDQRLYSVDNKEG